MRENFINIKTGKKVYISRYRSKVVNLQIQYYDINWKPLINMVKIESEVSEHGIKTETKSR
jgi:hypothetical protein